MSHNDMLCDMLNNSVVYFSEDWHISCCIISIFNIISEDDNYTCRFNRSAY